MIGDGVAIGNADLQFLLTFYLPVDKLLIRLMDLDFDIACSPQNLGGGTERPPP